MIATTAPPRRQALARRRGAPEQPALSDDHVKKMWLQGRAINTCLAYARHLAKFAAFLNGRSLLMATVTDLQDYGAVLQASHLGLASQYAALAALQSFYKFALDIDVIDRDPARALRLPRARDTLAARIVTVEQIRAIIAAAKGRFSTFNRDSYTVLEASRLLGVKTGDFFTLAKEGRWKFVPTPARRQTWSQVLRRHYFTRDLKTAGNRLPAFRDYVLIRLLYETGARISEVLALRWPDFTADVGGEALVTLFGKRSKTRTVRIGVEVWSLVQRLRGNGPKDEHVFRTDWRGPHALCRVHFTRTVAIIAKVAGLDMKVSPHWFRHAHASHSLDGGCPIHVLQQNLGHSSILSTERYCHVRPGDSSKNYLPIIDGPAAVPEHSRGRSRNAGLRGLRVVG